MQTFLPYADFQKSAECLDNKRLGKQRVEAMQILNVLHGKSKGWQHHPAVKMWQGYEDSLSYYLRCMIQEWLKRGYKNTIPIPQRVEVVLPAFVGSIKFHRSHQSNLLRKDKAHYSQFKWKVPDDLPYVWPINNKRREFSGIQVVELKELA
jgi:hypothetical protein